MNKGLCSLLLLLFCLSGLAADTYGDSIRTVQVDSATTYSLNGYIGYYEDSTLDAAPEDVLAVKEKGQLVRINGDANTNFGYTDSYLWLVIELQNTLDEPVDLFLSLPVPSINRLDLYRHNEGDSAFRLLSKTGDHLPFRYRPWPNRNFHFPIQLDPHDTSSFLMKIDKRGQNLNLRISLGRRAAVIQDDIPVYAAFGFYAGVFAFALLFNILLYLSVNDKIHLYYSLYIFFAVILVLDQEGLAKQWLFPNLGRLHDYLKGLSGAIASGLLIQVMQLFTNQNAQNSKLYRFTNYYKYFVWLAGVLPLFALPFPPHIGVEKTIFFTANLLGVLSVIVIVVCVIERIRDGFKLGYYYLLAISMLLVGVINYVLQVVGVVNVQILEPNGITVGLAIEVVVLSFALTQRYNFLKREKAQLKRENDAIKLQAVRQVFQAQEDERDRLAKDLHDDLGGTLSVIRLKVTDFKRKLAGLKPEERDVYDETIDLISRACDDLREISHSLKPKFFLENGLIGTIRERLSILNRVSAISFEFVYQYARHPTYEIELSIYRIINELINNVIKHSCASQATIQLVETSTDLVITVEDDGVGFDVGSASTGIGLRNVYSRTRYLGGTVHIDTNKNGTTFTIEIPLQNDGKDAK